MSWETIIMGALQGFSAFVNSFISIIGGSLNSAAIEGIIALFAISVIYRIFQGGARIPSKIAEKIKEKKDDDEEFEYVMVKRRK